MKNVQRQAKKRKPLINEQGLKPGKNYFKGTPHSGQGEILTMPQVTKDFKRSEKSYRKRKHRGWQKIGKGIIVS